MSKDRLQEDLLAAHADALSSEQSYQERYGPLFADELGELAPLFSLAARLRALFAESEPMRAEFRQSLKADLVAQAHQERLRRPNWRWAALSASVTVAGVLVAAAWRNSHYRGAI